MRFSAMQVNICGLKINNAEHGSGLSFGVNKRVGIFNSAKKTQGFGQQMASRTVQFAPFAGISDADLSDRNIRTGGFH
ncbi:MAG TPA: hypothetical protein VF260_06250 [Bacilli bacterium]